MDTLYRQDYDPDPGETLFGEEEEKPIPAGAPAPNKTQTTTEGALEFAPLMTYCSRKLGYPGIQFLSGPSHPSWGPRRSNDGLV